MEILVIFGIWISVLYIVRLKKEVSEYRKYFSQHDEIYVPSYKELTESNHWSIQFAKYLTSQVKVTKFKSAKLFIPIFRKRINEIATVLIGKRE